MSWISSSVSTSSLFPKDSRSQQKGITSLLAAVFFSWYLVSGFPQGVFPEFLWLPCCLFGQILQSFCFSSPGMYTSVQNNWAFWTRFTCCWFHHNTPLALEDLCCINSSLSSGSMLQWSTAGVLTQNKEVLATESWALLPEMPPGFRFYPIGQLWPNQSTAQGDTVTSWNGKYLPCLFIQQKQTLSNACFPNTCMWHISSLPICLMCFADIS